MTTYLEKLPVGSSTRGHNPQFVIIQSVDEADEPPGLRSVFLAEDGDVPDDDGVEHLGHLEVVVGPQRPGAQLLEVAVQDPAAVLFEVNVPSLDPDRDRLDVVRLLGGHELEDAVEVLLRTVLRDGGVEIQLVGSSEVLSSVINPRVQ